mgnify:CR=1 FL=1
MEEEAVGGLELERLALAALVGAFAEAAVMGLVVGARTTVAPMVEVVGVVAEAAAAAVVAVPAAAAVVAVPAVAAAVAAVAVLMLVRGASPDVLMASSAALASRCWMSGKAKVSAMRRLLHE